MVVPGPLNAHYIYFFLEDHVISAANGMSSKFLQDNPRANGYGHHCGFHSTDVLIEEYSAKRYLKAHAKYALEVSSINSYLWKTHAHITSESYLLSRTYVIQRELSSLAVSLTSYLKSDV